MPADNVRLAAKLRNACPPPNKIRLPGAIAFDIVGPTVRLTLTSACVEANMQDNSSSFEGWALALRRWLPEEVAGVEIGWTFGGDVRDPHYQRFLFRVQQFAALFPAWFTVAPPQAALLKNTLRTETEDSLFVTTPKKDRTVSTDCIGKDLGKVLSDEHQLECFINHKPEPLAQLLGITRMDRQFPVGLFAGSVRRGAEIFPRGHSAIDLLGVNGMELFLFELKDSTNSPIGILSELFFYSYVIEGIQQERFKIQPGQFDFRIPSDHILATKTVRAYILAPRWHPLIDGELLQMANTAFRDKGRPIRFGAIRIAVEDPRVYILETRASD